jgi:hypothetical protein
VLRSLPKKFERVVVPIEEFKDLSQMQIDELIGSLVSHESRISRYEEGSLEHAFKSQLHITRAEAEESFIIMEEVDFLVEETTKLN